MVKTMEMPADLMIHIEQEIDIDAPIAVAFEATLEQIGPGMEMMDGTKMPMKLEAWPGGRWYRDLGNNAGHFWGHVQVIKPPKLLELTGPMFMSLPVASHIQYRFAEEGKGTRLTLNHRVMGDMPPEHREGVGKGWAHILSSIKARAQGKK